jgi:hypothetical protein
LRELSETECDNGSWKFWSGARGFGGRCWTTGKIPGIAQVTATVGEMAGISGLWDCESPREEGAGISQKLFNK